VEPKRLKKKKLIHHKVSLYQLCHPNSIGIHFTYIHGRILICKSHKIHKIFILKYPMGFVFFLNRRQKAILFSYCTCSNQLHKSVNSFLSFMKILDIMF